VSSGIVVPVAKSLYLADGTLGYPGGKTDVMGLFNTITPTNGYPHTTAFVIFAQLHGGLGYVPFHIDIREGSITGPLVYLSNVHQLWFPHRDFTYQLAYAVPSCRFPRPGMYLVELFCNACWVADVNLELC
jgi:hypothetical protein